VTSQVAAMPLRRLQAAAPYLVVFAAGLFLYYEADSFQFEQVSGRIGPGAWPKLILLLMLVTAVWGIVSSARAVGKPVTEHAKADEVDDLVRPPEIYPYMVWIAVVATVGYLLLLPIFGFFLATIVYCFFMMYLGHYRRPLVVVLLSLTISCVFLFLFMRVVYVALPLGIPPFNEVSYTLMAIMGVR
jgi:putative tricarboxylic transport membrane protein